MEDLNQLKIVLVKKKRTSKWLAEQLGVNQTTVSKWLSLIHISSTDPLLIYECHIGMSQQEEKVGSYKEFQEKILPRIAKEGYNCIPVSYTHLLHGNNCLATAHEHDDLCGCDKFHLMHPDTSFVLS